LLDSLLQETKMKVKRQKRVMKILKYFHLNFGFRRPFNMLIDGTFCAGCLEAKVNIKEQMPKYIGEGVKLVTTGCCITEIESLGSPQLYGATLILKGMPLFRCDHKKPIGGSACIKSLIKDGNSHHFIVGTQDPSLREELRNVPGIPLLYLHGNAPTLEKPSALTENFTDSVSDGKTNLSQHQKNILTVLKEQTFGAPPEKPKRKKRKGPKGPNPLSVKKASKKKFSSSSPTAETTEEEAKKKRRKKKKIAAHVLEEIQS